MDSAIKQQPAHEAQFNSKQDQLEIETTNKEKSISENHLSSRDNFPKGLRGGGLCFDCLAGLCVCCALEEMGR